MLGAIVGDICGSIYEGRKYPGGEWNVPLFTQRSRFTDDTVLTVGCFEAMRDILQGKDELAAFRDRFQEYAKRYPQAGFGHKFRAWIENPVPYGSFGNGSAMRVSPIGWLCNEENEILTLARKSAEVSHNHPDGVKSAQAVALAVYMARNGASREAIRKKVEKLCGYDLGRSLKTIRQNGYRWSSWSSRSVPEAIIAFLDSDDFESAVRGAIWLGGDADTQAAIAGSIAEAFYGSVPQTMLSEARKYLDNHLSGKVDEWCDR